MIQIIILYIVLSILIGLTKSLADTIISGSFAAKFPHLANKSNSWWGNTSRKWKNGDKSQGEAFWLSSSILVPFTDFWHFLNLLNANLYNVLMLLSCYLCYKYSYFPQNTYYIYSVIFVFGSYILARTTHHINFTLIFNAKTKQY
jgi:hypothetical protein